MCAQLLRKLQPPLLHFTAGCAAGGDGSPHRPPRLAVSNLKGRGVMAGDFCSSKRCNRQELSHTSIW